MRETATARKTEAVVMKKGEAMLLPLLAEDGQKVEVAKGAVLVENVPYKIDTLLYVGSERSLKRYMKASFKQSLYDVDVDFSSVDGLTLECNREDGSLFILVWMPVFDWTAQKMAVLVHEVIHASVMVLRESGVHSTILEDGDDSDDEALAHTADHMTEALLDKLIKRDYVHKRKSAREKRN